MVSDLREIQEALAEPFTPEEVEFKPQTVKDSRALAVAYVDARVVMDRLDAVVGVANWQDTYEAHPDGTVTCRLSLRMGGEWIVKEDTGSESDQKDPGDRRKAAFSDALKRTAVKWGIGRYLYSLPMQWADYDPHKRQFTSKPKLPDWALPRPKKKPSMPRTGVELAQRLTAKDALLAGENKCKVGDLLAYVLARGVAEGAPRDLSKWADQHIARAKDLVAEFEAGHRLVATQEPSEPEPPVERDPKSAITADEQNLLVDTLEQKAARYDIVARAAKVPKKDLAKLTHAEWQRIMAHLSALPNA